MTGGDSKKSSGPAKIEDSLGEQSSKSKGVTESYDTDTFEDGSLSQSAGKKQGLQYWAAHRADAAESISMSQSKGEDEKEVFNPNAMEEYLAKQKQQKASGVVTAKPAIAKRSKDISESSDKYTDEDFDSISKS